jgi:hypothetical protein
MRLQDQRRCVCGQGSKALSGLDCLKVFRGKLAVTIVLHGIEAELLAFMDRRETRTLNGRNMDEDIRAAIVRLNEAEAFGRIEELNSSNGHDDFPFNRSNI